MDNRFSGPPGFPQNVWSNNPYINGNLIGSLSRFVYLIKLEEPSLKGQIIYQFPQYRNFSFRDPKWGLYPNSQAPGQFIFAYPDPTPQGFNTFFLFADWVAYRVDQTLDYYITSGIFHSTYGILRDVGKLDAYHVNMQTGFGRAAMYQGLTDPNTSAYTPRARNIASDFFNLITINDFCKSPILSYSSYVLKDKGNNSYWWYHAGWASQTRDCFPHQNVKDYYFYVTNVEDLSHGSLDVNFVNEYYKTQQLLIWNYGENYRVFHPDQMKKFKNTFTKNLYDGSGGFYNAVDGADGVIDKGPLPHNFYAYRAMSYMPLEEYDDGDGPSVYTILMNFYRDNVSNKSSRPSDYEGLSNKGHADVVAAQWKHECTNLELYNRHVVYNQDFFANNKLIITPQTSNLPGFISYAEPLTNAQEFIVQPNIYEPNIKVSMWAGESVTLKPGVQIKSGSTFKAYIAPSGCTDGARLASGTGNSKNPEQSVTNPIEENNKQVITKTIKLRAVPNPFSSSTSIQFSLDKESKVNLKLIDNFGRIVYESKEDVNCSAGFNEILITTESLAQGLYNCILKINNEEIQTINIVKQ